MMIAAVNEFLDDLRGGRMEESPVVTVQQGQLQGRLLADTHGSRAYYSFQGIPYAKPPLGSLRFKAPEPAESWEGIRDATTEGNVPAQINLSKEFEGDENCLFLNVYTPELNGSFLPVLVYIHGGGLQYGSGNSTLYGAEFLVEKDVVVVTLNYRCGPLGFLSLNTPEVPGNAGVKDIVLALKWVKENIANFGGNPNKITLFGESAGAGIVSLLTGSHLTKNLISGAILLSGNGLNQRVQKDPVNNAKSLAKKLGCDSEDAADVLEFLIATPVKDIVLASAAENLLNISGDIFTVVIEKEFLGVDYFLNEPFVNILTSGRASDVPIMIGSTALEFAPKTQSYDLQDLIPSELHISDADEIARIVERVKTLYFKDKEIGEESFYEYCQYLSDVKVNLPIYRYVKYLLQVSNKPIYLFRFDYFGQLNLNIEMLNPRKLEKAVHSSALGYLFKNYQQTGVEPSAQDVKMRERMVRLWTNFAKDGNPTPDQSHYLPTTWFPVTKDNLYYFNLGAELSLESNLDSEKMEFWENIYNKHYKIWNEQPQNIQEPEIVQTYTETFIVSTETKSSEEFSESQTTVVTEVVDSQPEAVIPEPEAVIPEPDVVIPEPDVVIPEPDVVSPEPDVVIPEPEVVIPEPEVVIPEPEVVIPEPDVVIPEVAEVKPITKLNNIIHVNGNGIDKKVPSRTSNEIKMVNNLNGAPKDVIRANDPPEDDLPKNIGVNKFVNFFESLGGKK